MASRQLPLSLHILALGGVFYGLSRRYNILRAFNIVCGGDGADSGGNELEAFPLCEIKTHAGD